MVFFLLAPEKVASAHSRTTRFLCVCVLLWRSCADAARKGENESVASEEIEVNDPAGTSGTPGKLAEISQIFSQPWSRMVQGVSEWQRQQRTGGADETSDETQLGRGTLKVRILSGEIYNNPWPTLDPFVEVEVGFSKKDVILENGQAGTIFRGSLQTTTRRAGNTVTPQFNTDLYFHLTDNSGVNSLKFHFWYDNKDHLMESSEVIPLQDRFGVTNTYKFSKGEISYQLEFTPAPSSTTSAEQQNKPQNKEFLMVNILSGTIPSVNKPSGKPKAFVEVQVGSTKRTEDPQQTVKYVFRGSGVPRSTKVVSNTLTPKFNEVLKLDLTDLTGSRELMLHFWYDKSHLLGSKQVRIPEYVGVLKHDETCKVTGGEVTYHLCHGQDDTKHGEAFCDSTFKEANDGETATWGTSNHN